MSGNGHPKGPGHDAEHNVHIWVLSNSGFANAAIMASLAVKSPTSISVGLPPGAVPPDPQHPENVPGAVLTTPYFKIILLIVGALTLLCLGAYIALAVIYPTPTPNQQTVFQNVGMAWTSGFGAFLGLLGGKNLP